MVFSPFLDVWHYVKAMKPAFLSSKPHFSFITIHYFWIIGMAFLGSIILVPAGNLRYIDSLFFASGAATQSGLNPVDVNLIFTYQQIVLFFVPMLCNPISINTFVVFLRLYWFEKRFQRIANEAKRTRRSISKTRTQMLEDAAGTERAEQGVNGRSIQVMHRTAQAGAGDGQLSNAHHIHGTDQAEQNDYAITFEKSDSMEAEKRAQYPSIKFAQRVKRSDGMVDDALRLPDQRSPEQHIAVLERQRNRNDGILRIPGPREAEQGIVPETIDEEESEEPAHGMIRRESSLGPQNRDGPSDRPGVDLANGNSNSQRPNVTIEEPEHVASHLKQNVTAARHTAGTLRFRKPRFLQGEKLHEDDHASKPKTRSMSFASFKTTFTRDKEPIPETPYLSWTPTIGRNSQFVDLTEEQREELGGIEYRSLKSLALILVIYNIGFTIFGIISLVPWILQMSSYNKIIKDDGQDPTWWGFFTAASAFTDLGFTLTPDSMISFQEAIWPLLVMSFLIIIGNTGFPIMLRGIIWMASKVVPTGSGIWEELRFLLDHPRRCFTLLFPSSATWWLFWILVVLNGLDLIFFIILDFGNPVVTDLSPNIRVLDGWFQAASTRTAGFSVVNLALLHPGIQVSYLIMMYISIFPVAISVRRTNVYEEKSLGIWATSAEEASDEAETSYVGSHIRRQLSFDLWYVFLGFFIIAIAEGPRIQNPDDPSFTLFSVLFEIVSAYGTVGLSLGYDGINASFSAEFGTIAKLVIIAMQIRGRHRGLPYELDRAILLPSESLQQSENEDSAALRRRASIASRSNEGGGEGLQMREESRSKTRERQPARDFLSSILHPGPPMPVRRYSTQKSNEEDGGAMNGMKGVTRAATHNPRDRNEGEKFELFSFDRRKKRMSI